MSTASKFSESATSDSIGCRKRAPAFTACMSSTKLPAQWGVRGAQRSERTFYGPTPAHLTGCAVGPG